MENLSEYRNNLNEILEIILNLKKEIEEFYLFLSSNFNLFENIDIFNKKKERLNESIGRLKGRLQTVSFLQPCEKINESKKNEEFEHLKNRIKDAVIEIGKINEAFSGLIKKNIHYNQLTISFITDAFSKSSIYNRSGSNESGFFPLKNILIGPGVKV
ncbi:flagellar export chaperone FlgN [Candidatus Acidulodesulfobacterium sp. H_13]|uniref:flagellar export chaperone FlgN n=1 Tax=Candidatus Acidulodesulfobacterium sp. H_13 TaxID=3395470 RepID=UPI003AF97F3C